MRLPDWIQQPVPDCDLQPQHDAIGKFVLACKGLEVWIAIQYTEFVDGMTYAKAMKVDISTQIDLLARHGDLIPEADHDEYLDSLAAARHIVELRNGVVHGIGWPNREGTAWLSERPDRRVKAVDEQQPWINVVYSRDLLIGAGLRATRISGFFQSHISTWPVLNQLLVDPGPDED